MSEKNGSPQTKNGKQNGLESFPPITSLVDEGIQKEVQKEIEGWNTRTNMDRYPLSPSKLGKCSLQLAREVAHYHGLADYPREGRDSRLHRIFQRGNTLEESLVNDFAKWTPLKMQLRQQRVWLFDVTHKGVTVPIEGNIDGVVVHEASGLRILIDFKSKGAFYSAGFGDSISEFFRELIQTGFVKDLGNNCFMITDFMALYKVIPKDDFFVDYLLQLNAYAFSDWFERNPIDAVSLYYENKNTCANYEVRWVPDRRLFKYGKDKFQWIFEQVHQGEVENVPKDFNYGSSRCRLCEYNAKCWGKYENGPPKEKTVGAAGESGEVVSAYSRYREGIANAKSATEAEEEIIKMMEQKGLTHIQMPDGLTYEKKYLKSPKPHFELRLVK